MSKSQKQKGSNTLIDNEQVHLGICRFLFAQNIGAITPAAMVNHLCQVLLPALRYSGKDTKVTTKTAAHTGIQIYGAGSSRI